MNSHLTEHYLAVKKVCPHVKAKCSSNFVLKKSEMVWYNFICILRYIIKCLNKTRNVRNEKKIQQWLSRGHRLGRWIKQLRNGGNCVILFHEILCCLNILKQAHITFIIIQKNPKSPHVVQLFSLKTFKNTFIFIDFCLTNKMVRYLKYASWRLDIHIHCERIPPIYPPLFSNFSIV